MSALSRLRTVGHQDLVYFYLCYYFILLSRYRDNFEPIQEALWSDVYLLLWTAERECMKRGEWGLFSWRGSLRVAAVKNQAGRHLSRLGSVGEGCVEAGRRSM